MSGLFRRARALRTRMELLGELKNDDFVLNIPDEEKRNVLSGIDSMLLDDKIRMDEGALRFIPGKRSFVLPLMLNVGAVVILGVGAFFMWRFFGRSETALVNPDVVLESAEGRILDRLREDAQAELGAKDREIADIRSVLSDLENQKDILAAETDSRLAEREEELRNEFDAALAAERTRLSESGVSGADLTVALAAYEAEVRGRFDAELAEARGAAIAEQERRVAELDAQRNLYESRIATADEERERLLEELAARNSEISEIEQAQSAGESEAARQLNALRASQQKERNVTDQILAFYGRVGNARLAGDSETALQTLDSLELYLREESIRSLKVVEDRRDTDEFLITAIRRLIALESGGAAAEPVVDTQSAETLAALASGAATGTRLADAGNIDAARDVWRNAFSAIPELQEAFETAIEESENAGAAAAGALAGAAGASAVELAAARSEGVTEGFSRGRAAGRDELAGEMEGELETVRREAFQDGRNAGLNEASGTIDGLKDRLEFLNSRIRAQADRFADSLARNDGDRVDSRNRVLGLLEDKLRIKSDLDVSLHESLEAYTDAAGDMRELEARDAVYTEILEFLSELTAGE